MFTGVKKLECLQVLRLWSNVYGGKGVCLPQLFGEISVVLPNAFYRNKTVSLCKSWRLLRSEGWHWPDQFFTIF